MSKTGVIGAMELEVSMIKDQMENKTITVIAGMEFCEGMVNGADCVIVRSGVGKINAAVCAQILIDCFHVTHIINTGVAGSLNPRFQIGDLLISADAIQHDVDGLNFGYPLGEIPQLGITAFQADKRMVQIAEDIATRDFTDITAIVGRVLTGDQFIADIQKKKQIIDLFHGDCCDMEGAAIAHCAYLNQIPFVIIRAISDNASGTAGIDYFTFEKEAAKVSARLVASMLSEI